MKSNEYWALYNGGNLWAVEKTQRACKEEAEKGSGEPWSECRDHFEIKRVEVAIVDRQQRRFT